MIYQQIVATESASLAESSRLIAVEVAQAETLEQLTHDEQCDRHRLELRVEQAFYQAGKALAQLRSRRLYRSTHRSFAAYCEDRFGFTRRHGDCLIAAAQVVENLRQPRTIPSQNQLHGLRTIPAPILPTKLEQVKPLASLKDADEQRQVWDKAVETANGKVPSGRLVRKTVEQRQEKPLVLAQDECLVGDVFILARLKGKDMKYNGCCCVTVELTDSAVIVDVHDTTLTAKPNNLDKIDSADVKQQLHQTLKRIRRLRGNSLLDRGADNVLKDLGKHTDLTVVEAGLLSWLEKYYKVDE